MAFHLLGLDASALMSDYMLKEFAASQGLKLTPSATRDKGLPHRMTDGDKILQIINVAKLCDMPIREYLIKEKIHDYPTRMVKQIAQNYESFKALSNVYDYTDMLWMAKTAELDLPELEYLFIDEAQDLSALQWTLVNRLAERANNIVIAGDDKQCQPAGSKVLTNKGFKNIEDLDENTDLLVSYARRDAQCYNRNSFRIKKQRYKGPLYHIQTPVGSFKVTSEHIHLVKWNNKDLTKNVVYLMQKGEYFRIGWCQLFNSNGGLHLGERMHKEKADQVWILKVCSSKQEASIYESIFAAKYGLPLVPFMPPHGVHYYTPEALEKVFRGVPEQGDKASLLLQDLGKSITDPFLQKGKRNRHGATIFECTTRNLEETLMSVPQRGSHNKEIHWLPIEYILVDPSFDDYVYGLDVEKYHTYVTDHGIITHNCINGFAGADIDTFLTLPGRVETLEQSYRVPMAAFDMANNIVVKMTKYRKEGSYWRCRRDMGQVQRITSIPIQKVRNGEDWLILARSGYQLQPLAQELFRLDENRKGIIFNINGNPPVDLQLYLLAQAWKDNREYLLDWVSPVLETDTAEVKECKQKYRALFSHFIKKQGKTVTQKRLETEARTPWYHVGNVDAMQRLYIEATLPEYRKKGSRLFTDAKVRLMTIHAAKGREATNVLLYLNLPRSVIETIRYGDSDTELKVLYVALTRTKKRLFLFSDKPQPYSYADLFT